MKRLRPLLASILILSVLFPNAVSSASAASQNRAEKHKTRPAIQTEAAQQQQAQVPLSAFEFSQAALVEAIGAVKAQQEAQREQTRGENKSSRWPRWLTLLRVQQGLLVVGTIYTVFACLQWAAIRRQANTMKETLEITQRANVSIEKVVFYPETTFTYVLRNSGRLPATETRVLSFAQWNERAFLPKVPEARDFKAAPDALVL